MTVQIGRWIIEPLYLVWIFIVAVALVALPAAAMGSDEKAFAAAFLVSFLASVPVHESGHVMIAEQRGFTIDRILVGRYSGVAWSSDDKEISVNDAIIVSAAGPLTNLAFAAAFAVLIVMVDGGDPAFAGAALAMLLATFLDLVPVVAKDRMSDGAVIRHAWGQRRS